MTMADKKTIQNIKTRVERTVQGLKAKSNEFKFKDTDTFVKEGTTYSIYFTLNKDKVYLTGLISSPQSRMIEKINEDSLFVKYGELVTVVRENYPKTKPSRPTDSDYRIGSITRYFTQKTNDSTKPIFEISKSDFDNKSNLYKYVSFEWKISGNKNDVQRDNLRVSNALERQFNGISKRLSPLQLYRPQKNSGEDVRKKLSLLRKT